MDPYKTPKQENAKKDYLNLLLQAHECGDTELENIAQETVNEYPLITQKTTYFDMPFHSLTCFCGPKRSFTRNQVLEYTASGKKYTRPNFTVLVSGAYAAATLIAHCTQQNVEEIRDASHEPLMLGFMGSVVAGFAIDSLVNLYFNHQAKKKITLSQKIIRSAMKKTTTKPL